MRVDEALVGGVQAVQLLDGRRRQPHGGAVEHRQLDELVNGISDGVALVGVSEALELTLAEPDLMRALDRQHDGTGFKRLGDVLVEMGLLAEGTLQAVVRRRMEELVSELLAWKGGFFRFEPATGSDADIEVDLGDFVLAGGLAPQEVLMRAVAALDRGAQLQIDAERSAEEVLLQVMNSDGVSTKQRLDVALPDQPGQMFAAALAGIAAAGAYKIFQAYIKKQQHR